MEKQTTRTHETKKLPINFFLFVSHSQETSGKQLFSLKLLFQIQLHQQVPFNIFIKRRRFDQIGTIVLGQLIPTRFIGSTNDNIIILNNRSFGELFSIYSEKSI